MTPVQITVELELYIAQYILRMRAQLLRVHYIVLNIVIITNVIKRQINTIYLYEYAVFILKH